jgi:hypothetical protein
VSDLGKVNYEAYREFTHGRSLVSGAMLPEWGGLPHEIQAGWNAGADAVEQWLSQAPVDEDAPGNEPAKVIIVTDDGGRDRRYAALDFGVMHDGTLVIGAEIGALAREGLRVDAAFAPGRWVRACKDGATVPDTAARKLAIAMAALGVISGCDDADSAQDAGQALEDIADVDR